MEKLTEKVMPAGGPKKQGEGLKKFHEVPYYRQALMGSLSADMFRQNPARLVWYSALLSAAALLIFVICQPGVSWPIKLACGISLGLVNAMMSFTIHELLHGSIIKNKLLQDVLGLIGFVPFLISPTFWRFNHNRLHHGKTQKLVEDPDAFPTLRFFRNSRYAQFVFPFTPGSGHLRSFFYFFFWFNFHHAVAQYYWRYKNGIFKGIEQRKVSIEMAIQVLIFTALAIYVGPSQWFWVFVIPMFAQNYLVMSYVSTNHNLSPLTKVNDPLANSVTVTNVPLFERFHINFGYHVEHHIFPSVNGIHMKKIHRELVRHFPEKFHSMPKWKAVLALYQTPRIYKNANELIHPETMKVTPVPTTVTPRPERSVSNPLLGILQPNPA